MQFLLMVHFHLSNISMTRSYNIDFEFCFVNSVHRTLGKKFAPGCCPSSQTLKSNKGFRPENKVEDQFTKASLRLIDRLVLLPAIPYTPLTCWRLTILLRIEKTGMHLFLRLAFARGQDNLKTQFINFNFKLLNITGKHRIRAFTTKVIPKQLKKRLQEHVSNLFQTERLRDEPDKIVRMMKWIEKHGSNQLPLICQLQAQQK